MTEEQIKQNAEVYAEERCIRYNEQYGACYDAYIAGAHSRDEEIVGYQSQINMMADALQQCMDELNKLHNPWISVKERLPKYCTIPSTEQYIKNRRYWDSKFAPTYLVMCSDKQGDYYQFANFIKFPEDKKPSWVFAEGYIKRNCVTHWMPIPKVNKEK